jgi:hypothetical protein
LDSDLNDKELALLEKALSESEELRKERDELMKLREIIGSVDYQFKHGFANRVMTRIKQSKNGKSIDFSFVMDLNRIFTRVVITGVAAILLLLISIYLTTGSVSLDSLSGTESYSEDNVISYLLLEE